MTRRRRDTTGEWIKHLRRNRAPRWLIAIVAVILLVIRALTDPSSPDGGATPIDTGTPGQSAVVLRVVDGDTLLLENRERVRLIGVDTPEAAQNGAPGEAGAMEATAFVRRRVEGRTVQLEFDRERQDRYGRFLAYVYIDGVLLNEEILREGFGTALPQFPYSNAMKKRFLAAEAEAQQARRGLWKERSSDRSHGSVSP